MKEVELNLGLEGRFRLIRRKAETLETVEDTGWFKNVILNQGLNRFGSAAYANNCQVGSGSATPAPTQTGLANFVAGTANTGGGDVEGRRSEPPYFGWTRRQFRFAAGTATGALTELGVGWTATGNNLFSRALILDANDNPTTIVVLSDEVLDVLYELRMYPRVEDRVFTTEIEGIERSCIIRAANVTSSSRWCPSFTSGVSQVPWPYVYNGPIGPITGSPSGNSSNGGNGTYPYVDGSLERVFEGTWGLNDANLVGGLSALTWIGINAGAWQMSFNPPLAKDNTKTLMLRYKVVWTRYAP